MDNAIYVDGRRKLPADDRPASDTARSLLDRLRAALSAVRDERGTLWMLQARVGRRTAAAAFRIATQLVAVSRGEPLAAKERSGHLPTS